MKTYIATTALVLASASVEASPLSLLFGKEAPAVGTPLQVEGPLLQMTTEGGTVLSFQHGSNFEVKDDGAVDLRKGNLRVGPAGGDTVKLALPSGEAEVEPLSAVTITVDKGKTSGRVYHGSLNVQGRTFVSGEGFEVTSKGAKATFSPQPAQAPALDSVPMPAVDGTVVAASSKAELKRWMPEYSVAAASSNTDDKEPTIVPAEPEVPVEEPATPQPEVPVPTDPEPPVVEPEIPTMPQPPVEEPQEPVADVNKNIDGWIAFAGADVNEALTMDASNATLGALVDSEGLVKINLVESSATSFDTTRLFMGTAELMDTSQIDDVAGLGRWVGGSLVSVKDGHVNMIANERTVGEGEDAVTLANSTHFVWGERATQIPTGGRVEYALHSATQPTYAVRDGSAGPDGAGMVFDGNLAIEFSQSYSGKAGIYHFNGTVTAPGENQVYSMSTHANGVDIKGNVLSNMGSLNVTSGVDAIACAGGQCGGTVNVLGFGAGMAQAGAAYSINPTGNVGIDGAAMFVAKP